MKALQLVSAIGLVFLIACGPSAEERVFEEKAKQDSISAGFISSSAAVENTKDSTHRFIRTADLKFKVKSVIKSTYNIEEITARQGGFVTYTNLNSSINYVNNTPVSEDSTLETTFYTVANTITVRVPNFNLDTTLKEISKNIDYLDYRIIKAEDVALQILANELTVKRSAKNEERLTNAIDKRGKKLRETTSAEETLLKKQEQADNAKISNLSLNDQIKFSTINIEIYQRQTIQRELIANTKNIDEYEPGFWKKILESLKTGWESFEYVIILLAKLWGIVLIAGIIYVIIVLVKKWFRKAE